VTGFRWWGAYTGVRDETDAPPADFFFVCSFADQAHLLVYDNVCYNVAFPVSRTSTGLHTQFGSLIFEYFGTITIPMVAGTHYLELVNLEERIGPAWGWSNAPSVGSPDGLWRWNGTNWDEFVAFGGLGLEVIGREVDAAVPEPASLALVTAGIGGIAARRYRRRRARPHA